MFENLKTSDISTGKGVEKILVRCQTFVYRIRALHPARTAVQSPMLSQRRAQGPYVMTLPNFCSALYSLSHC